MPGMHVGTQYFATDEKSMQFLQRFGVKNLDALVPDMEIDTLRKQVAILQKQMLSPPPRPNSTMPALLAKLKDELKYMRCPLNLSLGRAKVIFKFLFRKIVQCKPD